MSDIEVTPCNVVKGEANTTVQSLRICLVTPAYPPMVGGVSRYTWDLARGLVCRGHEVVVLVAPGDPPEGVETDLGGPVVRWLTQNLVEARFMRSLPGIMDLARSVQVLRVLQTLHDLRPFDVVEFASWRALGAAHSLAKVAPQVLRVTTGIAQVPQESGGLRGRFADRMGRWVLGTAERICLSNSDSIISPTKNHLRKLPARVRLAATVMPFGISQPIGHPRRSGNTVLYVGRLSGRKGFDLFAAAANFLLTKDPLARVTVVGRDHVDATGSAWEKFGAPLIHCYGDRVEWLSEVSDEELNILYWSSDVCAVPSRYESFGLVFIEAASHGVPVVAWDTPFAREVAGESATLVKPWNTRAYGDALCAALHAVREGHFSGAWLRELTEEQFGMQNFLDRTESLYVKLVTVPRDRRTGVPGSTPAARPTLEDS